ncbi:unnamed protein product, partial [Meganyctiphanes norvegica]
MDRFLDIQPGKNLFFHIIGGRSKDSRNSNTVTLMSPQQHLSHLADANTETSVTSTSKEDQKTAAWKVYKAVESCRIQLHTDILQTLSQMLITLQFIMSNSSDNIYSTNYLICVILALANLYSDISRVLACHIVASLFFDLSVLILGNYLCITILILDNSIDQLSLLPSSLGLITSQLSVLILGYYFRYFEVALTCSIVASLFFIALFFIPESPTYLYIKGKEESARRLLVKLRGVHADIDSELESYATLNKGSTSTATWRRLLEPEVLKKMAAICFLFLLHSGSGCLNVLVNASRMFAISGSSIDDQLASIIMMSPQFVGAFFIGYFLDRFGRKKVLMASFSIMCAALIPLTVYLYCNNHKEQDFWIYNQDFINNSTNSESSSYGWVPVLSLTVYQMGATLGVDQVPFILAVEYFPTWIRSQANSICATSETLFGFLSLQLYTPMMIGLTPMGLYAFYAAVCAIAIPYVAIVIEETSGTEVG